VDEECLQALGYPRAHDQRMEGNLRLDPAAGGEPAADGGRITAVRTFDEPEGPPGNASRARRAPAAKQARQARATGQSRAGAGVGPPSGIRRRLRSIESVKGLVPGFRVPVVSI
jgi:hypothetical protein